MEESFNNPNEIKLKRTVIFHGDEDAVKNRINRGANWILWIVGISMVNTIMVLSGSENFFNLGLGVTFVFDILFHSKIHGGDGASQSILNVINVIFDCIVYSIFIGMWYLSARKFIKWGLAVAAILFILDTVIFIFVGEFLPVLIHAVAIMYIWFGFSAFKEVEIKKL